MSAGCIFCKIIKRELPAHILFEDEKCLSFLDINPINEGHLLVIPKEHHDRLVQYAPETAGHLLATAQKILKALQKTQVRCEGANFFLSEGTAPGQVGVLSHLHLVPRYKGDGQRIGFIHGSGGEGARSKFPELAREISQNIDK